MLILAFASASRAYLLASYTDRYVGRRLEDAQGIGEDA
jgi:hypothetical protein